MEYSGKLYGKVGEGYFPLMETTEDVQNLKRRIAELEWVAVEDDRPEECESIIGIEMPCEARYACHREGNLYISDETGESIVITHWMYAPKPPCA